MIKSISRNLLELPDPRSAHKYFIIVHVFCLTYRLFLYPIYQIQELSLSQGYQKVTVRPEGHTKYLAIKQIKTMILTFMMDSLLRCNAQTNYGKQLLLHTTYNKKILTKRYYVIIYIYKLQFIHILWRYCHECIVVIL